MRKEFTQSAAIYPLVDHENKVKDESPIEVYLMLRTLLHGGAVIDTTTKVDYAYFMVPRFSADFRS